MRTSTNQVNNGTLINGYDYENQAWVIAGVYQDCGHPQPGEVMAPFPDLREESRVFEGCNCYGRAHAGEPCTVQGGTL